MKFGQDAARDGSLTETHSAPISCAVYNSKFRQVNIRFFQIHFLFVSIIFDDIGDNLCR